MWVDAHAFEEELSTFKTVPSGDQSLRTLRVV